MQTFRRSMNLLSLLLRSFKPNLIKRYHAYINDWKPTIGQNLSTCPEPNNIIGKYEVAVLKDGRVEGQLSKEKPYQYTKQSFISFKLTIYILLILQSKRKELIMEMDKACKFSARLTSFFS